MDGRQTVRGNRVLNKIAPLVRTGSPTPLPISLVQTPTVPPNSAFIGGQHCGRTPTLCAAVGENIQFDFFFSQPKKATATSHLFVLADEIIQSYGQVGKS